MTIGPVPVVIYERGLPRLLPREPVPCRPWPAAVIFVDVDRKYGTGGPAVLGRYLFRSAIGDRTQGWFAGRDGAPSGFVPPRGTGVVIPLLERRRRGYGGVLEDVIMKMAYREYPRAAIAAWDVNAVVGAIATETTAGGRDGGSLSHVLWPFLEGPRAGQENRYRPRVEVRPLEGGASKISFTGRWNHDPQDYVPPPGREGEQRGERTIRELKDAGWRPYEGRFADLRSLAKTTTGIDRLSLPTACHAYGISLKPASVIATPETLRARLDAAEQLYDAILAELA
jgi:hypothetical protein